MKKYAVLFLALCSVNAFAASELVIKMNGANDKGNGADIGTVTVTESQYGLIFTPNLHGLAPGLHGFHIHVNPSCEPKEKGGKMVPALGAGGHFDPKNTNMHGTPWGEGHLGDLPPLFVNAEGVSTQAVLAPRIKGLSEIKGRAIMIHAGGDNHSDHPAPLGGGGARVACGVIN